MMNQCVVCGSSDWQSLPSFVGPLVMTTAGKLVAGPLGKAQCRRCAAVQRISGGRLADTDYYERRYSYYDRPGAEALDIPRYRALAQWIQEACAGGRPATVFDVGCGRAGTIAQLREAWPDTIFGGIEPSADAVAAARTLGFDVTEGRLGTDGPTTGSFDLVFSNNVLQHTTDPVEFVRLQARLLSPDGLLVLSCPDGTEPNVELLMADQNFSLLPAHLDTIAAKAGMMVVRRLPCPGGPIRNEQLVVMRSMTSGRPLAPALPEPSAVAVSYTRLVNYLTAWSTLDAHLLTLTTNARRVFNFGGGLWSYMLAAYCPDYWARVECCLVDGFDGRCIDKEVRRFESVALSPDDILVLGTNPYVQPKLIDRFLQDGLRAASWNDIIPH
jgi:SAM-dependent methyltransferase